MFSAIYLQRVLEPSYHNWRKFLIPEFFRVQRAHLVMLAECGILNSAAVVALKKGIDTIEQEFQFPEEIPTGMEDLYFVFEHELAQRIGSEQAGRLHTARSRNDMDTTVLRLYLKRRLLETMRSLMEVSAMLSSRIQKDGGEPIVLYTHGQPANISTLGHYLSAFYLELLEGGEQLSHAVQTLDASTMGACALTTTGFPIDRIRTAELLGLARPVDNSYQAVSSNHWLTYPAAALWSLLSDITRFVMDLSHKTSCEVGLLSFPDELVQVSSIMPQKRNPVILEHIRIQAGLGMSILNGIENLFHNIPYQDVNEVADAPALELDRALNFSLSCFDLFSEIIRSMRVECGRVEEICRCFGITATELADSLVREQELDFRSAHRLVSEFVRSGGGKEVLRTSFARITGRTLPWTDEQIDEILSSERFIAVRRVPGGPAPGGMVSVLQRIEELHTSLEGFIDEMENRNFKAAEELARSWAALEKT